MTRTWEAVLHDVSRNCLTLLILSVTGSAQQYVISTYAGGASPLPHPAPGLEAFIGNPNAMAADSAGNVYFASLNCVFRLDGNGIVTRVAGNSRFGYSGDGGPAANAQLGNPRGLAVDTEGNVLIADTFNHCVRKVAPDGIITTMAGDGTSGHSGDGGPATSAQLASPTGLAVDGAGNLYIAHAFGGDVGPNSGVIRRVSSDGNIMTVAGGASSQLGAPNSLAIDRGGNLFVTGSCNNCVLRISSGGMISTVAGTGVRGHSGDGGPATSAQLNYPQSVAIDANDNLLIGEAGAIRQVDRNGIITTVAGTGESGYSGDNGPAISAQLSQLPVLATDAADNVYIGDSFNLRIRKVDRGGTITTAAGGRTYDNPPGDSGPATSARLSLGGLDPGAMGGSAADESGNLFIADTGNNRIRKVDTNGIITTIAGNGSRGFSGDNGRATEAQLNIPIGVAVDESGNMFIADWGNNRIRKVSPDGMITTVAGNGPAAVLPSDLPLGDGGPAVKARLGGPTGVAVDRAGNLFIADSNNWCIRKVSADGIITTWAGGGSLGGSASDGHPATDAKLYWQTGGLAVDSAGNLYIATYGDGMVHKVDPNGTITTAGRGDSVAWITGVAVDSDGTLYLSQTSDFRDGDERILKRSADGTVTTIAGRGPSGYAGDDGPAIDAQLREPAGLSVDKSGNVYFCDTGNSVVRVLRPVSDSRPTRAVRWSR